MSEVSRQQENIQAVIDQQRDRILVLQAVNATLQALRAEITSGAALQPARLGRYTLPSNPPAQAPR